MSIKIERRKAMQALQTALKARLKADPFHYTGKKLQMEVKQRAEFIMAEKRTIAAQHARTLSSM